MWTILFGSVVNKTNYLIGYTALLIVNSLSVLFFLILSIRYLKVVNLKIACFALEKKIDINNNYLFLIFKAFLIVVVIYLSLFDLYHQNILSALQNGGLLQSGEKVRVSYGNIFKFYSYTTPSSDLFFKFVQVVRRIFNPFVSAGKQPLFSRSLYTLVYRYFYNMKNLFYK